MNEKVNGSAAAGMPHQVTGTIQRTVINTYPGLKIVYILQPAGIYLGSITVDFMSPDALKAMANDLQVFAAEQTGGLQVATGLPPGLVKSS